MSVVLDASAILAYLQGEAGSDVVGQALTGDSRCSAVNWSEVAQKVRAAGRDWDLARALLAVEGVQVEDVTVIDAEWAAARWRREEGLSLADRLCMALAHRLGAPALTADTGWGTDGPVRQIR